MYSGGDQAKRTNPHQGSDGEEEWRIMVTTQNQDRPLEDTAGIPASLMAGRA
jgi:hypothetical protein